MMGTWLDINSSLFSFIGLLVSLIALGISVWQICLVKKVDKGVAEVEKATREKIERTLNLVSVVETKTQIQSIQDSLRQKDWECVELRMSTLLSSLSSLSEYSISKQSFRKDYEKRMAQLKADLSAVRNYKEEKLTPSKIASINSNLDEIIQNIVLLENKLK